MKRCLFLILTFCAMGSYAQVAPTTEPPVQTMYGLLQFNTPFYNLENHWAVVAKNPQNNEYVFGFVYLDNSAGYSFHIEGAFAVDAQGHVALDTAEARRRKIGIQIIRIVKTFKLCSPIPDAMLPALQVSAVPFWLSTYQPPGQDVNSVTYKVTHGKHLNGAGAVTKALEYLESAYKTEPHAAGLEFELAYAYNVLGRYNDALTITKAGLAKAPDNSALFVERGFAYSQSKDYDNAITTYIQGIAIAKQKRDNVSRMSMNTNLVFIYTQKQQNDKAIALINDYIADEPTLSSLYILLGNIYFQMNDFDSIAKTYIKAIDNVRDVEARAELALSLATLYRDKLNNPAEFTNWASKAKQWAPASGRAAAGLKGMGL